MSDNMSLVKKEIPQEVDLKNFNADEKKQIESIAQGINVEDSQVVLTYGIGAQREISDFSENILQQVRSKDAGFAGDILTDLMLKVKDLNVDSLANDKGFLSGIPIVGNLIDAVKKFIAKYEKLSVQIEKIVEELDKTRMTLIKDLTLLDNMYEKNLEYLKNLDIFIAAGQIKIKELNEKILPELKKKAEQTNDPIDSQKLQDLSQIINRFDKKIHDLKLSRMITIQSAPQLRLIQNNDQALVEKIQSSILNTIPLWKNQIVIAITIFRQKKGIQLQKKVTDTTNELLAKNSEMLKQNLIDIAKETERGIVDIETLKKVNNDLISTIQETLKIQEDGRQKRKLAEVELLKMENELKEKLKAVK